MTARRGPPRTSAWSRFFARLFGGGAFRSSAVSAGGSVQWQSVDTGGLSENVSGRRTPTLDIPRRNPPAPRRVSAPQARGSVAADASARVASPGSVFTPTQPKAGRRRLVGREAELQRILQALQDDRAHVVLFSERGRGKTSLSNLAVESLRRSGVVVARHTCEASTTFDSLIRGLMQDLPPSLLTAPIGAASEGCEAALPAGPLRPRDVVALPQRLACRSLVCLVDEFDRVRDETTRTWLADTIKQLSDRDVPLLFLIVGVSENLDQILGQHPSIQRNIAGIHLPLFTDRDVAQVIARGGHETGLTFSPAAIGCITSLARGMPYMAQLLGLRLAQAAVARGDTRVLEEDFEAAILRVLDEASPRVEALYATLTAHGQDSDMIQALRSIASAPQDAWGRLIVLPDPASPGGMLVGGRPITQACWDKLQDAPVLQAVLPGSSLYSFAERGLMHHALLLAIHDTIQLADQPAPGKTEPLPAARNRASDDELFVPHGRQRLASLSRP